MIDRRAATQMYVGEIYASATNSFASRPWLDHKICQGDHYKLQLVLENVPGQVL